MQIAKHPVLSDAQRVAHLPPHVGTLGVLAGWNPKAVEAAIASKDVTPDLERAKATELSGEYGPVKQLPTTPGRVDRPLKEPVAERMTPPDDGAGEDDGFMRLTNKDGSKVKIGTRSNDPDRMLTAKGMPEATRRHLIGDPDSEPAQALTPDAMAKGLFLSLGMMAPERAREVLQPYESLILGILGMNPRKRTAPGP
jgi:hypothetical protein